MTDEEALDVLTRDLNEGSSEETHLRARLARLDAIERALAIASADFNAPLDFEGWSTIGSSVRKDVCEPFEPGNGPSVADALIRLAERAGR